MNEAPVTTNPRNPTQNAGGASRPAKKAKRPALMLQLTDEEDRGKPDTSNAAASNPISTELDYMQEESKISMSTS